MLRSCNVDVKNKRVERFIRGGSISKPCTRVLVDDGGVVAVVGPLGVPIGQ